MRFIDALCPPALLYLIYIVVQTGLDISLGLYFTAIAKFILGVAGTFVLDAFCGVDLGIVSWVIVATPFIITSLATSISIGLGLDRMIFKKIESFSPLTADNKKNRDIFVTQLKQQDALPISTDSIY